MRSHTLFVLTLTAIPAFADFTDFSSDATGFVPNGFVSVDAPNIVFSDTVGADLRLNDWALQSDGIGLAILDDDPSRLRMDFVENVSEVFLDFGNDAGYVDGDGIIWAWMIGYNGGVQVASTSLMSNDDDILNQTIGIIGEFDAAEFYYGDSIGNPIDHAEIVDNVRTAPIPAPSSGLIALCMLCASTRRRR